MIALAVSLIVALAFAGLAWVARLHPVVLLRRSIQVGASIAVVVSLVAGLLLMPASRSWQADRSVAALNAQTEAEVTRATRMIGVLGSPAAYVEYLKATQEK